jgi:hypothetical protein
MKIIKLTDEHDKTRNDTQWGENVTHTADGKSTALCNKHWVHGYRDIYVALLINPTHAFYNPCHAWECEGVVGLEFADKLGCTSLATINRIDLPDITLEMRREFARLVSLEIYSLWQKYDTDGNWLAWAQSQNSADAPVYAVEAAHGAVYAAHAAAHAAVDAAAHAAVDAAGAAVEAAHAAADAAVDAAVDAAGAAVDAAAGAGVDAAHAAVNAAGPVTSTLTPGRMVELAHQACKGAI